MKSEFEGWTNKEQLKFIIQFAGMNLSKLRPGDFLNLFDDLQCCIGSPVGRLEFKPIIGTQIQNFSDQQLRPIQGKLKVLLDVFVGVSPGLTGGEPIPIRLEYFAAQDSEGEPIVRALGSVEDCFFGVFFALLQTNNTSKVVRCESCKRIFFREGKRKFCTDQCTDRMMQKRKRERDKGNATKAMIRSKTKGQKNGRSGSGKSKR